MHRDKIQRMGSSIDTRAPAPQPHLTLYGRDYVAKKRATTEAAFSDLKMIQSIAKTMTRKAEIPERKGPVSLNADSRKTEIFRIMKENHKLLDRLETLEPIVSTADLMRSGKDRTRYKILVSHSKRLAGEYDSDVERIRLEDQAKTDAMNRSLQARMNKYEKQRMLQNSSGSTSMPSLTPLASTDPGILSTSPASPAPAPKKRVARQLGVPGGVASSSSSSKSSPPPPSNKPGAAADTATAAKGEKRDSKVSFEGGNIETSDNQRSEWQRKGGPTPHPKKASTAEELFYEESETPAKASEAQAPAAATSVSQSPSEKVTIGVAGAGSPQVGAAASSQNESQNYQDDFVDETQNSMSKGPDDTFETSAATFEESRDG